MRMTSRCKPERCSRRTSRMAVAAWCTARRSRPERPRSSTRWRWRTVGSQPESPRTTTLSITRGELRTVRSPFAPNPSAAVRRGICFPVTGNPPAGCLRPETDRTGSRSRSDVRWALAAGRRATVPERFDQRHGHRRTDDLVDGSREPGRSRVPLASESGRLAAIADRVRAPQLPRRASRCGGRIPRPRSPDRALSEEAVTRLNRTGNKTPSPTSPCRASSARRPQPLATGSDPGAFAAGRGRYDRDVCPFKLRSSDGLSAQAQRTQSLSRGSLLPTGSVAIFRRHGPAFERIRALAGEWSSLHRDPPRRCCDGRT